MKVRIKRIICHIIFIISCFVIFYPTDYGLGDWKFWVTALGIFGLYFIGRYEEHNGL